MKTYLVERTDPIDYDDYDSFICVANSEEEARWMMPDPEYHMWKDGVYCCSYGDQKPANIEFSSWTKDPKTLKVTEIDPSSYSTSAVVLASFNAG